MTTIRARVFVVALAAILLVPAMAFATNGYFAHGIGLKSKGMGGVGVALPQDALAGGYNPAGMAFVGNRFDIGVDWFRPDRGSEIHDSMGPVNAKYDANGETDFYMPELGANIMVTEAVALGISIYGHGGMNTSYKTPIPLFDQTMTTNAGVDMSQLFIVPTVAWKFNENHSFGLGVNVVWQQFEAMGLANFDNEMMSAAPGKVTDNGTDSATGVGATLGWYGRLGCSVFGGVAYQSRTYMGKFEKYSGLFAEQGGFDVPPKLTAGVTTIPSERSVVSVEVGYIWFSSVKSIANSGSEQALLGSDGGPGFGWEDTPVVKIGGAYDVAVTLRAGYNYGKQPIPQDETLFNMLAPGVVEHHATLGGTWRLNENMELTLSYVHAFENTVKGKDSIPDTNPPGGGEADITMSQNSFGLGFGMTF